MASDIPSPPQPNYPVEYGNICLRPITEADVPAVNSYRSLPDVVRYLPHPPHTVEDTELIVSSMVSERNLTEPGQWLDLAVEFGPSKDAVGEVLLKWDAENPQCGEIGFVFSPAVQGRDIAYAACAAALGMRLEATFVEAGWNKGEWATLRHYAILNREWSSP